METHTMHRLSSRLLALACAVCVLGFGATANAAKAKAKKAGRGADPAEASKKKKEAQSEVAAALRLSDEQKTKLAGAERELPSAQTSLPKKLRGVLAADAPNKATTKAKKKKTA